MIVVNKNRRNKKDSYDDLSVYDLYPFLSPYAKKFLPYLLGTQGFPSRDAFLSVFFCDVVGFTNKTEMYGSEQVIDLLKTALNMVSNVIHLHQGEIEKFMGDAIMAVFDDPESAVAAGINIQRDFYMMNVMRKFSDELPIELRIGINSGMVTLSEFGNDSRKEITIIGDVVNTASRIEAKSPIGKVSISKSTYDLINRRVNVEKKMEVLVKGKEEPVQMYIINSITTEIDGISQTITIKGESDNLTKDLDVLMNK